MEEQYRRLEKISWFWAYRPVAISIAFSPRQFFQQQKQLGIQRFSGIKKEPFRRQTLNGSTTKRLIISVCKGIIHQLRLADFDFQCLVCINISKKQTS